MHEMGVTQSLLNITLEHAQRANAVRVNELRIVVGELSSIVDDSVQFYWDFVSQGTIAEKARLTFRRIPATMRAYAMQGTPTLVVVDRVGLRRFQRFGHIKDLTLGSLLGSLLGLDGEHIVGARRAVGSGGAGPRGGQAESSGGAECPEHGAD